LTRTPDIGASHGNESNSTLYGSIAQAPAAQRKIEGRRAFAVSLSTAMLGL
jgi:hypothetical protein